MPEDASQRPFSAVPGLLTPEAQRALAEAEARRAAAENAPQGTAADEPKEIDGRQGPDPVRFGDWEKGGIASDF